MPFPFKIYSFEGFYYTVVTEMMFVVINILQKILNEKKKDNKTFFVFDISIV